MAPESATIVESLHQALQTLTDSPSPPFLDLPNCSRRASVAVVLRIRSSSPAGAPFTGGDVKQDADALRQFFSQSWVQQGDTEVLFIRRAGGPHDKWGGHMALPGGRRAAEDMDDLATAIRETREEVGLNLNNHSCLYIGSLSQRVVAGNGGKPLMVLCPYIFLLTSPEVPTLQPQPNEVASIHWVSLRVFASPNSRTALYFDATSRITSRFGPFVRYLLQTMTGKMALSAINLTPSESIHVSQLPGFLREEPDHEKQSADSSLQKLLLQQPLLLWGTTLGIISDFLDLLPQFDTNTVWRYPSFATPDLRVLVYLFTRSIRRVIDASYLNAGTWPPMPDEYSLPSKDRIINDTKTSHIGKDGITRNGTGQQSNANDGQLLSDYFHRLDVAVAVFLAYRTILGTSVALWLYRTLKRRHKSRL